MLKYFHNEFMGSVASNYHENNKVKDFLANFWWLYEVNESLSGVLEKAYGEIHFLVRLKVSILQLYWGLSSFGEVSQKCF